MSLSSQSRSPRATVARRWLLAVGLAVALLTGCSSAAQLDDATGGGESGGGDVGASQVGDDAAVWEGQDGAAVAEPGAAAEDADGGDGAAAADALLALQQQQAQGRMIARDATLALQVDDVVAAAARVRAAATAAGGWVASEELRPGTGEGDSGHATIVLSVPSESLDGTMSQVIELGEVTGQTVSTDDVTGEFVDTQARVETLEASVARLRALVQEARSVDDIARLESELSRREADLDALKARLQALEEDVSRSSLTVHLAEDRDDLADAEPATGFLAGLSAGWNAFLTSLATAVTVIGAVLPFVLLAALLVLPLWWWRRRRATPHRRRPTRQPAPSTSGGES